MKITVPKSTVEAALAPIQKMLTCAILPFDINPDLTFKSDKHCVWIGCNLSRHMLEIAMPDAAFDSKDTSFHVNMDMFRRMISKSMGTRLVIEHDATRVQLSIDDVFIGSLVPTFVRNNEAFQIPKEADSAILPTSFAQFVMQAFSCASTEDNNLAMKGVNVSSHGLAGTDGRQLFHLPLPLKLNEDVTLPPSKSYAIMKDMRWTSLAHWTNSSNERMFAIHGEGFRYVGKAMNAPYPDYMKAMAAARSNDVMFLLKPESAKQMTACLHDDKQEVFGDLTVYPDRIELVKTDVKDCKLVKNVFSATSTSMNLPCTVRIDFGYLRQFLKMGFLSMSISSKSDSPLASLGGTGRYMFMPCGTPNKDNMQATSSDGEVVCTTNQPDNASHCKTTNNLQTTKQAKEKTTMTQTTTQPTVQTNTFKPAQSTTPQTPSSTNPLEETLALISTMREQLTNLESRLMEAGRNIKSALVEQRQKDRQFADATRKLERIRLAV